MSAWLGVVSADHVQRAQANGFAQVNHGSRGALARMRKGDTLIYYSPRQTRDGGEPVRAFTAVGVVADDEIVQADEGCFMPHRRRVTYEQSRSVALDDLRARLALTSTPNWGYQLRRGLIRLSDEDADLIRASMTT